MQLNPASTIRRHLRRLNMAVVGGGLAWMAMAATTASAQWTVVNLHPAGATYSQAYGVGGGQQVGEAGTGGTHAALWSGTAASWVDLHPAGANQSVAMGVDGGQQVGWASVPSGFSILSRASLWSGSATSWVDLTPDGAMNSIAYAVAGGQQVGWSDVDGHGALRWSGTAGSWVNLHPYGQGTASASEVNGVGGGQQVGWAQVDSIPQSASLWTGTAASWVDLHPVGSISSRAWAAEAGQQVGWTSLDASTVHATLWSGSAASWVDLNPVASFRSQAYGVDGGQQVGHFQPVGGRRACLWSGTAASRVDLHAFLPAGFTSSEARGIWSDGAATYVVGFGFNNNTSRTEALMWVGPPGEASAPGPVPDGYFVPGTPMTVQKNGNLLDIAWDVSSCAASPFYNIYAGTLGNFSLVTEATCALPNTGTATISLAGERAWFVLAGADGSSVGSFGRHSGGPERVLTDWDTACAELIQDTSQTCP